MSEWHAWHDDDWQSEVLDDDGNYYRDGDTLDLPDTVNRGAAGQRLDMEHGFLRHIQQLQRGRQTYEEANPSGSIQQRYSAVERPQQRRAQEESNLLALTEAQRDSLQNSSRYVPPHLRSKGSPAHPAALAADKGIPPGFEEVTPQPPFASAKQQSSPRNVTQNAGTHSSRSGIQPGNIDGPVQPLIAVAQPSSSDYNGSFSLAMPSQGAPEADSADSAAAGERRHRKFRQGFAAYTAPPLLDRHGKEVPNGTSPGASPVTAAPDLLIIHAGTAQPEHAVPQQSFTDAWSAGLADKAAVSGKWKQQESRQQANFSQAQPAHIAGTSEPQKAALAGGDMPPGFCGTSSVPAGSEQAAPAGSQHQPSVQSAADRPPGFAKAADRKVLTAKPIAVQLPKAQPLQTAQPVALRPALRDDHYNSVAQKQQAVLVSPQPAEPTTAVGMGQDDLPPGFSASSRQGHAVLVPRMQQQQAAPPSTTNTKPADVAVGKIGKQSVKPATTQSQQAKSQQAKQAAAPAQGVSIVANRYDNEYELPPGYPAPPKHSRPHASASFNQPPPPGSATSSQPVHPPAAPLPASKDLPPGFSASAQPGKITVAPPRHNAAPISRSNSNTPATAPSLPAHPQDQAAKPSTAAATGQRQASGTAAKPRGSQAPVQRPWDALAERSDSLTATSSSSKQPPMIASTSKAAGINPAAASQSTSAHKRTQKPRQPMLYAATAQTQEAGDELPPGFAGVKLQQPSTAATVLTAPLAAVTAAVSAAPAKVAIVADHARASLVKHLGTKQPSNPTAGTESPPTAAGAQDDRPPGFFAAAASAVTKAFAAGGDERPPGFNKAPQQQAPAGRGSQQETQGPNTLLPQAQAAPWPAMIDNQDSVSPQSVISRPHMNAEVEHQGDSFPQGASSKYQQVAPQHMQSRSSGHRTQLLCSTASHDHQPYPKDTDMQGSHYGQEVYTTAWVVRTGQQLHHAVQHDSPTGDVYQPKSESWYSAQAASRQAHQPLTSALLSEHAHLAYEQEQAQIQHRMERIRLARKQLDLTLKAIEQGSYLAATYQPQGTTHTAGQHHYHGQHDPQHSVQYRGSPTSVSPAAQQLHPQTSMHYGTYTQPLQAEYPSHQQVGFSQAYTSSPHAEGHYAQHAPSSPAYQKKHCVPHISHQGHQSIPAGQHDAYAHPSSGSPQMIVPQHAQRPHPLDFVQIQQSHYPSPLHSKTGQNAGSYSEHASSQHSIIVSHHPSSHVQSDPYGYQAHAQPLGPSGRQPTCHYEDDQHSPNACQYHSPQEFQQAVPAGAGSFLQGTVSPAQSQMAGQQHARSRQGSTQPHTQQQLDPDVVPIYHRPSQRRHKQPPAEQLAYEVQQQVHDASPAQSGQQYQHHMMQRRGSQVRPHHEPDNDGHHQHSMDGAQPFANGQMRAPPQQMLGHHPATLGNTAADTAPHHASVMNGYQSGIESEAAQDGDMSGSDTYAHLPGRRRKLAEVIPAYMHYGFHG